MHMAFEGTQSDALKQLGVSYPQFIDYYSEQRAATLVQFCTLALVTWDCIITFDGEIAFFWQTEKQLRWSVARILFMLNRYVPIMGFSLHVYWRVNRSLDSPLCTIRNVMYYIIIPMFVIIALLQFIKVWSLYHRLRSVGLFLLALFVCGAFGSILGRSFPTPEGIPLAQLGRISVFGRGYSNVRKAPESLTGCGYEPTNGVLDRIFGLIVETVLLAMTILKLCKSRTHASTMPLFRALLVDGAIFYLVLAFTFVLDITANMNNELYYPVVDTNFSICLGVITCNHLILSLREARDRHISTEQLSTLAERTANKGFTPQAFNVAPTYADQSETILPYQRIATDEHTTLAREPDPWHEMLPVGGSTALV